MGHGHDKELDRPHHEDRAAEQRDDPRVFGVDRREEVAEEDDDGGWSDRQDENMFFLGEPFLAGSETNFD